MKVFLFVFFIIQPLFASSDVDWNLVFDYCRDSRNKTVYCKSIQDYESYLDDQVSLILSQNLSPLKKDVLTVAYYLATDNLTYSWKIKNNYHLVLNYKILSNLTKISINYNF